MSSHPELRPFTEADLPAAHALTQIFGWPHRLADWAFMARLGVGVAAEMDGALVGALPQPGAVTNFALSSQAFG